MLLSSDEPPSEEVELAKSEETNLKDEDKSTENSDIGQLGEDKVLGTENSLSDDVITDGTDGTEHITSQNTPEADLQSDPDTAESEKIISESKSLLDSSTEAVLLDSESSHLAGAEDPDSLPNTEPTNVSDLENTQKEDSLSSLSDSDAYVTTETVTVGVPVASHSDLTSDTVPLNDTETAFFTAADELPEVDGTPEYIDTAKEIESSKTPVPESAYLSKEELNVNSQDELGDNGLSLEIPNAASAFSSAGIPAPSISFQVIPGKILVPAAADQVQCQAFAALQVLKVILFFVILCRTSLCCLMV